MTTIQTLKSNAVFQAALINAACVILACLIPALSHFSALPLYKCNPMLILMLTAIALTHRCRVSQHGLYLSAIAMPAISSLLVGMPSHAISVCIAVELCTVVAVLQYAGLRRGYLSTLAFTFIAMVCGKMVYYFLKWLLVTPDILVSTQWQTQILVAIITATLFASVLYFVNRDLMRK